MTDLILNRQEAAEPFFEIVNRYEDSSEVEGNELAESILKQVQDAAKDLILKRHYEVIGVQHTDCADAFFVTVSAWTYEEAANAAIRKMFSDFPDITEVWTNGVRRAGEDNWRSDGNGGDRDELAQGKFADGYEFARSSDGTEWVLCYRSEEIGRASEYGRAEEIRTEHYKKNNPA